MKIEIRSALPDDQQQIAALVKSERLNPMNLDWRRFVVATDQRNLVGAVQIRRHRDAALELGSLVVQPAYRQQGIARALIDAALRDTSGTIWMITRAAHAGHYAAWGFARGEPGTAPRSVRFNYRIGRAARVLSWLRGQEPANLTLLVRGQVNRGASEAGPVGLARSRRA